MQGPLSTTAFATLITECINTMLNSNADHRLIVNMISQYKNPGHIGALASFYADLLTPRDAPSYVAFSGCARPSHSAVNQIPRDQGTTAAAPFTRQIGFDLGSSTSKTGNVYQSASASCDPAPTTNCPSNVFDSRFIEPEIKQRNAHPALGVRAPTFGAPEMSVNNRISDQLQQASDLPRTI